MAKSNLPALSQKPYVKMLVADEFRMEQNGKALAIGLYADSVVVLTIPKNAPQPSKETPVGFDGVALLLTVGGVVGEATVRFGLEGGKALEHLVDLAPGSSANLVLNLKPFRVATFGVKRLIVEFAGTTFKLPFEIRAKYIEAVDDLENYVSIRQEMPATEYRPAKAVEAKAKPAKKRLPKRTEA